MLPPKITSEFRIILATVIVLLGWLGAVVIPHDYKFEKDRGLLPQTDRVQTAGIPSSSGSFGENKSNSSDESAEIAPDSFVALDSKKNGSSPSEFAEPTRIPSENYSLAESKTVKKSTNNSSADNPNPVGKTKPSFELPPILKEPDSSKPDEKGGQTEGSWIVKQDPVPEISKDSFTSPTFGPSEPVPWNTANNDFENEVAQELAKQNINSKIPETEKQNNTASESDKLAKSNNSNGNKQTKSQITQDNTNKDNTNKKNSVAPKKEPNKVEKKPLVSPSAPEKNNVKNTDNKKTDKQDEVSLNPDSKKKGTASDKPTDKNVTENNKQKPKEEKKNPTTKANDSVKPAESSKMENVVKTDSPVTSSVKPTIATQSGIAQSSVNMEPNKNQSKTIPAEKPGSSNKKDVLSQEVVKSNPQETQKKAADLTPVPDQSSKTIASNESKSTSTKSNLQNTGTTVPKTEQNADNSDPLSLASVLNPVKSDKTQSEPKKPIITKEPVTSNPVLSQSSSNAKSPSTVKKTAPLPVQQSDRSITNPVYETKPAAREPIAQVNADLFPGIDPKTIYVLKPVSKGSSSTATPIEIEPPQTLNVTPAAPLEPSKDLPQLPTALENGSFQTAVKRPNLPNTVSLYSVQTGDTPQKLRSKFHWTDQLFDYFLTLNDLKSQSIELKTGTNLLIP